MVIPDKVADMCLGVLTGTELKVFLAVAYEEDENLNVEEIAGIVGINSAIVYNALDCLEKKGLLIIERSGSGRGHSNRYFIPDFGEEEEVRDAKTQLHADAQRDH